MSSLPLQSTDTNQRIELEYGWEILIDRTARMQRDAAEKADGWRSARVGLSWNAQFEDLRDYMGAAWYRLKFELPTFRDTRHVLLKFGAVDYFCEVFLNGLLIGTHEGGYTPFSFEITSAIRSGINEIFVRVIDPPMDEVQNRALFPDMMYNEIPHGKQNWYVQNSGIWQGVRIELCPSIYIERLDVTPQSDGSFEVVARLAGVGLSANNGEIAAATTLETEILESSGRRVFHDVRKIDGSSPVTHIPGMIASPRLWSPESPALYTLKVSLSGPVEYRRNTRFGFRSFEARDGKLYLNGEPFYMMAALDQDFYPETVHTPTSVEFVRDMMMKAKHLGINLLRCHLKVAHPVYLDVADEVGMLIWTELPSWSDCWFPADHFSSMAAVRADKMFWEILIRDWNHPCIVLQTIINESWGINLKDASQREWLRTTFDRVKGLLAPLGRLVVDNSACEGNFHLKTDIEDFHQYYSMPDQVAQWNKWLHELSTRPAWTFSPHGDAERSGREPLLVSEFGNWGLPKLPTELPWWFGVSFGGRQVTRPDGVLERFERFGFKQLFGTFNQMAEETQWHQFTSLKYEIESIRSCEPLQGYVITGITDVHWEVNGLLDMWRNQKIYAEELSRLQQPDLIMCKLPAYSFRSGEAVEIQTLIAHFSDLNLAGARVRWSTYSGAGGIFTIADDLRRGSVTKLEHLHFELPEVSTPTMERFEIEVHTRNGHRITENAYDLFVLPVPASESKPGLKVVGQKLAMLASALQMAGYKFTDQLPVSGVVVADLYDSSLEEHLRSGGSGVLIANSEGALPSDWPIRLKLRAGNELDGRWFSNYNWIKLKQSPFSAIASTPILGFESALAAPEFVIQNIEPEQFTDVLSGITLGWLNCNSALALQLRVGAGKLLVTTFRFDQYGSDPFSTQLLDSLIQYVGSAECQPNLEFPARVAAGPEASPVLLKDTSEPT